MNTYPLLLSVNGGSPLNRKIALSKMRYVKCDKIKAHIVPH